MINVKNELQYLLVVQTLENAAHEGLLSAEELTAAKRFAAMKYRPATVWE